MILIYFNRYWQELGYIIIYATARPDIQQHKVVHWLAQHNFPHGTTNLECYSIDHLSNEYCLDQSI
jgi:hypothetical protein